MVVFAFVFVSYFLVLSGVVYDIITEPPSMGMSKTENGGTKPMAFMAGRINGQYIIEGLTAGFFFALGGVGFIMLDRSVDVELAKRNRVLLAIGGAFTVLLSYLLCLVFIRIKVPNY